MEVSVEDLKQAMGVDIEPVESPSTAFGYCNRDWKPWRMPDGLEILVSEEFRVTTHASRFSAQPKGFFSRSQVRKW